MRGRITAPVAVVAGVLAAAPAPADVSAPSFVDHTEWAFLDGSPRLPSLRVYPTAVGRAAARESAAETHGEQAWLEVLAHTPDADTPGMREQFLCHWQFAELAQPGKVSWNLEPWRPVVDTATMADAGCNPGGPEDGF